MSILIKKALIEGEQKDILIEGNKISKIADNIDTADEIINAEGMAALPGMVNAHTHAAMTLLRGYADDMPLKQWLEQKIWPMEAKLTEEDVYWGTRLAILEMIKSGTTLFNDMYWHFKGTLRAVEDSGIRAVLSLVFIDNYDDKKTSEQIRQVKELFQLPRSKRVQFSLGPHAVYTVSKQGLRWCKEFADKHNLTIHIHLSETEKEADECETENGARPVQYLDRIGFLGPKVVAAHGVWLSNEELDLLAKRKVKIVHNPVSNMKLCSGSAIRYEEMKKRGIEMHLGTDGTSSNNNLDMFEEMKIASLLQKHDAEKPTIMPAQEVFDMATNAKVFGLDYGIKEGCVADLILVDLRHPSLVPCHNLVSNLVYSANGDCVNTTIVNGKVLMRDRKVEGEEEIISKAKEIARRLIS